VALLLAFSSRMIVVWATLKLRAIDVNGSPAARRCRASWRWCGLADGCEDVQKIPGRSRQPIEPADDEHVALVERFQGFCQLGAI
jgi:hypothetical protein